MPSISKEKAIKLIDQQIALCEEAKRASIDVTRFYESEVYHRAYNGAENLVARLFDQDEMMRFRSSVTVGGIDDRHDYNVHLLHCISQLQIYKSNIENFWPDDAEPTKQDAIKILGWLVRRLPQVIHELRQRHEDRPTLDVDDEYDLQDLIRSLLFLHFDDVRKEEGTPSLGGTNGRMDFLLYNEKTVVELKMTNANLRNKKLKEQLLADIPHYKKHQDCKAFVGIVYDPRRYVSNPVGFETDLSEPSNGMPVHVFIVQG